MATGTAGPLPHDGLGSAGSGGKGSIPSQVPFWAQSRPTSRKVNVSMCLIQRLDFVKGPQSASQETSDQKLTM